MKTINAKYIKSDKCRVPRSRLVECVFYLRNGEVTDSASSSHIWYSKPKISKILGISTREVNRILKDEIPPHLKPSLLKDDKKSVLTDDQVAYLTSSETMQKQRLLTIAERCKAFNDRYPTVTITPYCLRKVYY